MGGKEKQRVVLIPYPAQGHITPIVQLAAVFHLKGFQPLIVTPLFIHEQLVISKKSEESLIFVPLPDGLDKNEPRNFFTIHSSMENILPRHLDLLLGRLQDGGHVACVVVDLLASWAIEIARSHEIPVAGFWPAMLATYNLVSAIPNMMQAGLISENGSPVSEGAVQFLPGQPKLSTEDLPWLVGNPAQRRSRFQFWLQTLERCKSLPWLFINSFPDEDCQHPQHTAAKPATHVHRPSQFHVGPLTRRSNSNPSLWEEDKSCLEWLNRQNARSVIYVSFGSWVGPIGEGKVGELALGLQATQRPFIWVLGCEWRGGLPRGYMEEVGMQGKVVTWAPQKELLRHEAVGCFLTHCGWNSTAEAIDGGKPLLCYPVSGDQFVNSKYIVDVWGIGVRMGGMGRGEVEEGVRKVMEGGEEMVRRVKELKERITGEEDSRAVAAFNAFLDSLQKKHLRGGECVPSLVGDTRANLRVSRPGPRETAMISPCIG